MWDIDIPVLVHVVNYDFPVGACVFVHRVGRTVHAGRHSWAWSFVSPTELPHLLNLQLFLGRPLRAEVDAGAGEQPYNTALVLGAFPHDVLGEEAEYIAALDATHGALSTLREVSMWPSSISRSMRCVATTAPCE